MFWYCRLTTCKAVTVDLPSVNKREGLYQGTDVVLLMVSRSLLSPLKSVVLLGAHVLSATVCRFGADFWGADDPLVRNLSILCKICRLGFIRLYGWRDSVRRFCLSCTDPSHPCVRSR